jgi:hypothetical protein
MTPGRAQDDTVHVTHRVLRPERDRPATGSQGADEQMSRSDCGRDMTVVNATCLSDQMLTKRVFFRLLRAERHEPLPA